MPIFLSWNNDNNQSDQITRIYRSTQNITKDDLPAEPLVVFENKETSFIDESALAGVMYTYIVEIETPFDKVYSRPIRRTVGFDSLWGDGDDSIIHGNPNTFALGRNITNSDMPDGILRHVMRMLGANQYYDSFYKIVNAGRYFIIPRDPINVRFSNLFTNNCFLGHRSFNFAETTDASKYGNNDYFIYRGRKWRVGLPQHNNSPVTTNMLTFKTTEVAVDSERGYATADMLARQSEFTNLFCNMYVIGPTAQYGRTIPAISGITSASTITVLSSLVTGTKSTPDIARMSSYQTSNEVVSFTSVAWPDPNASTTIQAIPHIEYLGVA